MTRARLMIRLLLAGASVLLGIGLVAPCMTVVPSVGETWDNWLRWLKPDELEPTTYSMLGGILELMRGDSLWLGILLLAFSVVFPSVKLATQWWGVGEIVAGRQGGFALWFSHHAGKFSMLDVMVIAVLIIVIKGLPGETTIRVQWGIFAFAASVLLSMVASLLIKRLEKTVRPPA